MNAEIISVGTELLLGNIVNTNSRFLSEKLAELGLDVYYHTNVGDNKHRIRETLNIALKRTKIIIFTGGLGPTDDDLTKEVVAESLNMDLVLDKKWLTNLEQLFKKYNREMTNNNIKQAYIPAGSTIIPNDMGTAPGIFIKRDENIIILLPGPPKELNYMFSNYVSEILKQKSPVVIKSKTLKTLGIGESALETRIDYLIKNQSNPTIATYAKEGQVDLRITAKASNTEEANVLIDKMIDELNKNIGEYVYSYNNESIEEVVFKLLDQKKLKVGFCESCTGGLISSRLTKIPGSSRVFERSIITYSNEAKVDELFVNKNTLDIYGAVSKEVAFEMAKGLLERDNIDICISITGIAGPSGGNINKPVGLVYIGIMTNEYYYVNKYNFTGDRESIQSKAADSAFNELRKYVLKLN